MRAQYLTTRHSRFEVAHGDFNMFCPVLLSGGENLVQLQIGDASR